MSFLRFCFTLTLLLLVSSAWAEDKPPVDGNAQLRAKAGSSEIVITTTKRLAGAIHSLTWGGKEFIDSHDHGRQLQSACSFDCGTFKDFWAEAFNPTEAGSRADGRGEKSASKLLRFSAKENEIQSVTQMAFWLAPNEKSSGHPALNTKVLSDYLLTKKVRLGYKEWAQVLEYEVTFEIPAGEKHTYAQFEALTGYMPPDFSQFWKYTLATRELKPLDDGPGEQETPIIFSTPNGEHAMGVYSPDQPSQGYEKAGYGRFRFKAEKVVKWNCVFRTREPKGVPAGKYSFRIFVAIGTLKDVQVMLDGLAKAFAKP